MSRSMLVLAALFAAACSSGGSSTASPATSSTASGVTDGVNDVLKACEIRTTWTNALSTACGRCTAYASTPRCACADTDYAGKCSDQAAAKAREPSCDGVDACVEKCGLTDCACVDACYAGKTACRQVASALDGCLAEVCDASCR